MDQEVLLFLLLTHTFASGSTLHKDNLPLDLLKIILNFADILFLFPKPKESKLSLQISQYDWKEYNERDDFDNFWQFVPSFIIGIWIAMHVLHFMDMNHLEIVVLIGLVSSYLIWRVSFNLIFYLKSL